jgi:hypothetical protein
MDIKTTHIDTNVTCGIEARDSLSCDSVEILSIICAIIIGAAIC